MSKVILIDRSNLIRIAFPYTFPIDFTALQTISGTSRGGKAVVIGAALGKVALLSGVDSSANQVIIL